MIILGIEAAARCCSTAVWEKGRILAEEKSNAGFTHSETLMPMVARALSLSGKSIDVVDVIALTNGPGSFTGLRIGAASAKGLALGLSKPLLPVGTLEALTFTDHLPGVVRAGVMDARRSQVYCAAYETVDGEETTVLEPDTLSAEEFADKLAALDRPVLMMGDAMDLYRTLFTEKLGKHFHEAPAHLKDLSAAAVCSLAAFKLAEAEKTGTVATVPSDELTIDYLRKPQAVREREEREARAAAAAAASASEGQA